MDILAHPTLDPIGSLLVSMTVPARGSSQLRLLTGLATDKKHAIDLITRHLELPHARSVAPARQRASSHPIGHGEIPPGTSQPYCEFTEDGRSLLVRTPFTPRPSTTRLPTALDTWSW